MRMLSRTGLVLSAMTLGVAVAQAATPYDGTYVGVSATQTSGSSHCVAAQMPAPLTISNGTAASTAGYFTGTVDAQGHIVLHTKEQTRFEGQVDAGSIKVGGSFGFGSCAYSIVWKKQ